MPEADGYVRIKTELDDAGLIKKMSGIAGTINRQTLALEKAKENAAALAAELQKVSQPGYMSKEAKALEKEFANSEKTVAKLQQQFDSLANEIDEKTALNINGNYDEELARLNAQLGPIAAELDVAKAKAEELRNALSFAKAHPEMSQDAQKLSQDLRLADEEVKRLEADLQNSKQAMAALQAPAEKVTESINRSNGAVSRFTSYIGRLAKRMLILYAFRRVFTYIRNSIMSLSGLSVVTGAFTDFNNKMKEAYASNEQIQASLAKLRGALAMSFQPIYSAVVPALSSLISWLAKAIQTIAAFFAALSGKSLNDSADGAKNLAKGIGAAGGAAKQANKQLATFDKLNSLSEQSGGGGGGGGAAADDYSSLIDDGKLAKIAAFADKIRTIFRSLFDFIKKNFDFESFWNNVKITFRGIIDFLTGVFTGDWDRAFSGLAKIVEGFGGAIQNVLDFVAAILDSVLGWAENLLVSFFNWLSKKTGYDFSGIIRIIHDAFDTIRGFVSSVISNIKTIIQGIVDFVAGVFTGDWRRAWTGVTEIVRGAFNAVANAVIYAINNIITIINSFLSFANNVINSLGGRADMHIGLIPYRYAEGGFPSVGSMFIAGEAGPELVGSFGSHNNSVINEAQLVQAFRQASSEQVALMEQQNNLLAAILNKELTFKPSSTAGKMFSQSIGMYNRAMGV